MDFKDIKLGTVISIDNQPFVVVQARHSKQARGGAVLKTKLKNLISGSVLEQTYKSGDSAEDADLERTKGDFLYEDDNTFVFMNNDDFEQFELDSEIIGDAAYYLKAGLRIDILKYNGSPVSIKLPNKVELEVTEAPPAIKGDTQGTVTKSITLETGHEIQAPLFVNQGDIIRVNTETDEYVERV